jgi:ketosteroid isomerase-like protein
VSQENVKLARSIYAAWERGDYDSTEWAHPEIEVAAIGDTPTPGSAKGLAEMAGVWREWLSAWEEFRTDAEGYLDLDDEHVLVFARFGGRGKASGVEVGQIWTKGASLFRMRGGKVTKLVLYTDHVRALADLGLSEQDVHAET